MVLSEDLFKNALVREKKRAERFDEPFVLVLVAARWGRRRLAPSMALDAW